MLDPARHFLPCDDACRFLDAMARYRFNRLQLHLTDDQGWRLPVEGHPERTRGGDHYTPTTCGASCAMPIGSGSR